MMEEWNDEWEYWNNGIMEEWIGNALMGCRLQVVG
jgi:hypothetical protein